MKAGLMVALLAIAPFAGCTAGNANPHLLSPKLVVHARDDGNVSLYVHSAFGDRVYDRIVLTIDNTSVETKTEAFSLETRYPGPGFFLDLNAALDRETYWLRARVDVEPDAERAQLVVVDPEGVWGEPEQYALPYGRVVERVSE